MRFSKNCIPTCSNEVVPLTATFRSRNLFVDVGNASIASHLVYRDYMRCAVMRDRVHATALAVYLATLMPVAAAIVYRRHIFQHHRVVVSMLIVVCYVRLAILLPTGRCNWFFTPRFNTSIRPRRQRLITDG